MITKLVSYKKKAALEALIDIDNSVIHFNYNGANTIIDDDEKTVVAVNSAGLATHIATVVNVDDVFYSYNYKEIFERKVNSKMSGYRSEPFYVAFFDKTVTPGLYALKDLPVLEIILGNSNSISIRMMTINIGDHSFNQSAAQTMSVTVVDGISVSFDRALFSARFGPVGISAIQFIVHMLDKTRAEVLPEFKLFPKYGNRIHFRDSKKTKIYEYYITDLELENYYTAVDYLH